MTVARLMPYTTTVFAEMSALAARIGAVNLGQGFPDEDGPPAMLAAARQAIADGVNQYPPGLGIASLREAIAADRYLKYGVGYDPEREVLVTVGATEAIAAAVIGLVEPGSEVLLIEPYYDSYAPVLAMAQAQRATVPLVADGPGFALDVDALRRAITPRTAALIVNSPHNPTGMVLRASELAAIAEVAVEADLLVMTDEVYEHLVFDDARHIPLAALPGMADRTVTISSAAKMFNCTGWKIGWACGPADIIAGVRAAKQFLSYVGGAPFQPAVALALATQQDWVVALRKTLQARRDRLAAGLAEIGFDVHHSGGTYFLCADPRPLGYTDSTAFCAELPHRAGVAAIPLSAFCDPGGSHAAAWNHLVRFTFCKTDDTLDEALRRLSTLASGAT
jgi:N-succinyldiaminopimelate aminotransferase